MNGQLGLPTVRTPMKTAVRGRQRLAKQTPVGANWIASNTPMKSVVPGTSRLVTWQQKFGHVDCFRYAQEQGLCLGQ
jgi:hypothetical protein